MLLSFFLAVSFSALAAWWLLCALLPKFNRCLLDLPNARSSHSQPTPRGGGLSFLLVSAAAGCINIFLLPFFSPHLSNSASHLTMASLLLLSLPLALVGFLDDQHNLSASLRYVLQLFTALLLFLVSPLPLAWLLLPLLLVGVTAVINFTNFMDGLDGLVAGCMVIAISALSLSLNAPWSLWSLVGSLLGFLLWNWSPAKVFMGDVGSTFLGAVFAGLVLQASSWIEAFGYLLVATPLLADACLCVPRRLLTGQSIFQAHRLHLFQRLHQAGWPHSRVSVTYISATAVLAVAMLAGGCSLVFGLAVAELLLGIWLDQRFAVPFAVASKS